VDTIFPSRACSYQRYQGEKLARRFDAYSYWYLSHSVDSQNVGRGRGGVEAALGRIKARITVVAIDSDLIFPPEEVGMMSKALAVPLKTISSKFGHDGFLLETEQITAILQPILNEL
jgi:homoserine O-acetyltransferase